MLKWLLRILCSPLFLVFYLLGWRVVGTVPPVKKAVVIGAPHTSNWDYLVYLLMACWVGMRPTVLAKHQLFQGLAGIFVGPVMRLTGAIPINSSAPLPVVEQVAAMFEWREKMLLLLSPEGRRERTEYWQRGFYYIAMRAHVPIVLVFLDFAGKRAGFGPTLMPTGDVHADMAVIREFYENNASGLYPHEFGPVRLRAEDRGE